MASLGRSRPTHAVVLPSGKVCVSDEGKASLVVFTKDANKAKQPDIAVAFECPTGLACSNEMLYVADAGTHQIHRLRLHDFSAAGVAGAIGSGRAELTSPQGMVLAEGTLFVVDSHNHRIVRYQPHLLEPMGEPIGREGSGPGELRFPHGIAALGEAGNGTTELVVTDSQNHRLTCFTPAGLFTRSIGSYGSGAGQFEEPTGVAVHDGQLHVVERRRIQVLCGVTCACLRVICPAALGGVGGGGDHGSGGDTCLNGICVGKARAYVTDARGGRLHYFELAAPLNEMSPASDAPLLKPTLALPAVLEGSVEGSVAATMTCSASGSAAVPMDASLLDVSLLSPDVISTLFEHMQLAAFLPAASVCTRWATEARAKRRELEALRFRHTLGSDALAHPTHVLALGGAGGPLLVAESATSCLRLLTSSGEILGQLGTRGTGPSDFSEPRGIATDGEHVYVADAQLRRLQKRRLPIDWIRRPYTLEKGFEGFAVLMNTEPEPAGGGGMGGVGGGGVGGGMGGGAAGGVGGAAVGGPPEGARRPEGLALTPDGQQLWVSDRGAHCIVGYEVSRLGHSRPVGHSLRPVTTLGRRGSAGGELCDPGGLCFMGDGGELLFVADTSNHRLTVFNRIDGTFVRTLGRHGVAPGCFHLPSAVAAARGYIIVAEKRRVQVLLPNGVPQQVVAPPGMGSLHGIHVRADEGSVLVADPQVRRIHEFELVRYAEGA
jgi:sugar lactone lactonase YvrE